MLIRILEFHFFYRLLEEFYMEVILQESVKLKIADPDSIYLQGSASIQPRTSMKYEYKISMLLVVLIFSPSHHPRSCARTTFAATWACRLPSPSCTWTELIAPDNPDREGGQSWAYLPTFSPKVRKTLQVLRRILDIFKKSEL